MKKQYLSTMLNELASVAVPAESVNLTNSVIAAAEREHSRQHNTARTLRFATMAAALLILIAGSMMFTPSARASIDGMLKRLGLELAPEETTRNMTGMMLEPTFVPVTAVPVTLDEIAGQAPFVVRHPSILPNGLVYQTGEINNRGDGNIQVLLLYHDPAIPPQNPDAPLMMLEISDGDISPIFVSEEAARDTTVSGQPAIYIRGGWTNAEPIEPGETFQGLFWDYTFNEHYLTWEQDGLAYRIQIHNIALDMQSVIQIAESLK